MMTCALLGIGTVWPAHIDKVSTAGFIVALDMSSGLDEDCRVRWRRKTSRNASPAQGPQLPDVRGEAFEAEVLYFD